MVARTNIYEKYKCTYPENFLISLQETAKKINVVELTTIKFFELWKKPLDIIGYDYDIMDFANNYEYIY